MWLDTTLLLSLNSIASNSSWNAIATLFGNDALVRGGPIFATFLIVWFAEAGTSNQIKMLTGLFITFCAVLTSVGLQFLVTPHIRPFLDPAFPFQGQMADMQLHRLSSFPSDSACLYAGICMTIGLDHPRAGLLCALWALLTVGLCRVILGYHYPSDILAGMLLGAASVGLLSSPRLVCAVTSRMTNSFHVPASALNVGMFIVMADAYNQFFGLIGILHGLHALVRAW